MGKIDVHYGNEILPIEVDKKALIYELRPADVAIAENLEEEIKRALQFPIDSKPLREIVRPGDRVAVLADDITRLTPTKEILPYVLNELNKGGVPDEDIFLVIALGTHRPMTENEIITKYGAEIRQRIRIINHDCLNEANLIFYGNTRRGTEIWVNRFVIEADVKVGIGNIVPHHPTGWSGGAKILLPGVAGEKTTGQFHLLGATEQMLGRIETPCREEMEDFAAAVGFDFIINTILDRRGRVIRIVAGDIIAAHRNGVQWGQKVFGAPFSRKSDITLSSTYPVDYDLFQADKGLFSAAISTKPGGEIILLSPCYEGISPTHSEAVALAQLRDDKLFALARDVRSKNDVLSIAEVLYFNSVKRNFQVTLVSEGVPEKVAKEFHFNYLQPEELQAYLNRRLSKGSTLGVVHYSAETLPVKNP